MPQIKRQLWPFSQGELNGEPDGFTDAVFTLGPELRHESEVTRSDYAARIVRGGLPEATTRDDPQRRERFHDAYVQALIDRDVRQLSDIQHKGELRRLVRLLAARSATIIAANALESTLGLSRPTIARYLQALEEIFLVKRIPGWSRNLGTRATAAPKLVFVDSGIAANEIAVDARALLRPGAPFGPLLESFVLSELSRHLTWSEQQVDLPTTVTRASTRSTRSSRTDPARSSALKSRRPRPSGLTTSAGYAGSPTASAMTSSPASFSTPEGPRCRSATSCALCRSAPCGRFPLQQEDDLALP